MKGPGRDVAQPQFDAERLLAAGLRRFPLGNPHGVFGMDVGPRIRRGRALPECTLRLYVARKRPSIGEAFTRPFSIGDGRRIVADVIATGAAAQTLEGEGPVFSGVHVGAAVLAGRRDAGGIGAILSEGGGPSHVLTAGHLFPRDADEVVVRCARAGAAPRPIGKLVLNLLDARPRSLAMDVALVQLNAFGVELALEDDNPRPPRPQAVCDPVGDGLVVQAFRPTAHDYSTSNALSTLPRAVHLISRARPDGYTVRDVLRSAQEITRRGDSGTAFLTFSADRELVGTCVGVDGRGSLVEPARRAIDRLRALTGSDWELWVKNGE